MVNNGMEEMDWLEETEEEARAYDKRIKEEIRWKLDPIKPRTEETIPATSSPVAVLNEPPCMPVPRLASESTLRNSSDALPGDGDRTGAVPEADAHELGEQDIFGSGNNQDTNGPGSEEQSTMMDFSMPSFRPSNIAHSTPKPISTSTFPHIPTPTFTSTPALPAHKVVTPGPSRPRISSNLVNETPIHVPSPIDTPIGEGRGRRDDPATPVPLGVEKFNLLKGKKDFQTLTKHFEMFTKQSDRLKKAAAEPSIKGKGKGKMQTQGKGSEVLGGKVFEGLRICFPPEMGNTSKQKTHWDIVRYLHSLLDRVELME